ncbi:MAG TPA: GDP-fucose synthetase [Planctomycetaceae bacterium]|nr:GDP-fucose synthetase [Planctomycetaceae bacterium]
MDKTSKIFVAGHQGLVGSAIVRRLRRQGYENLLLRNRSELDLVSQAAVEIFFRTEKPDYVFLAAAKVGGILANDTYRAEFMYVNLMIAANVIDAAYRHGTRKLLNLGSSCIYPKAAPQPIPETALLTSPLETTNEPYALAKIAALKMCRYYNEQFGSDFLSVMPTNLYGEGDNFDLFNSHVLPALLRKFYLGERLAAGDWAAIRANLARHRDTESAAGKTEAELTDFLDQQGVAANAITLWGSGEPYREFLHVDDLARACVFLMERYSAHELGECVNVGTGADLTIRELAETVRATVGFPGDICWDRTKPDGTPRKRLNVARIRQLGWEPHIPLAEGIRRTFEWYRGGA